MALQKTKSSADNEKKRKSNDPRGNLPADFIWQKKTESIEKNVAQIPGGLDCVAMNSDSYFSYLRFKVLIVYFIETSSCTHRLRYVEHVECGPCGLSKTFPQMFSFVCRACPRAYLISTSVMLYQTSHTLVKVKIITFKRHLGNRESHNIKYMLVDYWMGYLAFFFSLSFFPNFWWYKLKLGKSKTNQI